MRSGLPRSPAAAAAAGEIDIDSRSKHSTTGGTRPAAKVTAIDVPLPLPMAASLFPIHIVAESFSRTADTLFIEVYVGDTPLDGCDTPRSLYHFRSHGSRYDVVVRP